MLLNFSNWLIFSLLGFSPDSRLGESLSFFVYDTVKILLLLFAVIFIIGVLRSYLPRRKLKKWLHKEGIIAYILAALFGAVTPFCSCSSIPIFFGFIAAGIPLGVVFTFLIVSPIINEYLVVLMAASFGWQIAALYVVNGIIIGIAAGAILGKLNLERYIVKDIFNDENGNGAAYPDFKSRIRYGFREASSITGKIWYWVVAGVAVGAIIHNYVPQAAIESVVGKAGFLGVPIAVVLGVPMYGSCAAIVPIALVLFQKGVPLGTALSFMMAVSALSLPAAIMLRRAIKIQMIIIFFGVTTAAIIFTGYLFNMLQVFF
jgi:hypothetical protein